MVEKYSGNAGSTRAIYHTSHMMPYLVFLGGAKFLRAVGIFMSYDILKVVHVVQFLFLVKSCSAVFLVFIQKPFTSGKRISKHQWFRISRHALLGSILTVLWLFGLSLCGPLRTILLFEHSDMVVLAGAAALFTNNTTPSRFRGAVFFLLAVMSILLFDHDDVTHHGTEHQQHHNSAFLSHLFNHLTHFTGLSDHKGGVVLLFLTLGLQVGYNSAAKKLSVDVGGAKRLHALSTLVSALLLMPWALFVFATKESLIPSWWSLAVPIVVVAVFLHVLDYYADALAVAKAEAWRAQRYGGVAVCGAAMALGVLWNHPLVLGITPEQAAVLPEDHVLSGGVVFSFVLILFATHILTNPQKGSKGSMVGYSASGLPLYNFPAGDAIQRTSQSMLTLLRNGLRQILEDSDSRKIFYFLCINLSFTFVELLYGVWTNSLGLISDGFHMLFDCWALVMGLYASVMARWKATRTFSYGYDRVEILSGFTNGLFLMVIAFFVFLAACTRLFDPPEIHTERLLAVSVLGLVVNLLGIVAFRHGHSHGGGGHGHSHGGGGHGHSHGGHGHGHSHGHDGLTDNANMEGVFLHVLADTLGSVGVIISTLFIENFGWTIADPICSLFIATLIFVSVMPLVKETALVLLLRTPGHMQDELAAALHKILKVEGVLSYRKEHFWRHSSKVVCGTIHVQTAPEASEQKTIAQVTSILKEVGVQNLTIQVEKQAFYQHMTGLGFSLDDVMERTDTIKALDYNTHASYYIKAI